MSDCVLCLEVRGLGLKGEEEKCTTTDVMNRHWLLAHCCHPCLLRCAAPVGLIAIAAIVILCI